MEKTQFSQLPISDQVKKAVAEMGYEEATTIQSQSIPLILDGVDVIGHSQTGTGKTAAFGIPVIEKIDMTKRNKLQALILCPTRELAVQACEEMQKFAKYKQNIKIVPIYGGQPIERQFRALSRGAEIVIGTPGRVMDHMRRKTINFSNLSMVVLDEADEMLNMGFRDDIETILSDVPENRQTILFSATMSKDILRITKNYQKNPTLLKVAHQQMTVPNIKQYYFEAPVGKKMELLCRLLDYYNPTRSMVFCNTKKMVDELVNSLQMRGYQSEGLHGDMKQTARTQVMDSFKRGRTDILVATDVAARGIDVDDMEAVFNFDLPQDLEYYIHRIGRTGRAGKSGRAMSIISGRRQIQELKMIESHIKTKITLKQIPSLSEVEEIRTEKTITQIKNSLAKDDFKKYQNIVDKLIEEEYTSVDIACAVLDLFLVNDMVADEFEMTKQFDREKDKYKSKDREFKDKDYKDKKKKSSSKKNCEKVMFNIGTKDKIMPNHVLGAIVGETGIPAKSIGQIDIHESYTTVEVPNEDVYTVIEGMKSARIKGIKTKCSLVSKGSKK